MEIECRFFATVREAVGERATIRSFEPGTTVRGALAVLEDEHPELRGTLLEENGTIAGSVTVLRNGTHVTHYEDEQTKLADGDTLSITPPVTGG